MKFSVKPSSKYSKLSFSIACANFKTPFNPTLFTPAFNINDFKLERYLISLTIA